MVEKLTQSDEAVDQIAAALEGFEESHQHAECVVYRYNPASIRVKIVDEIFRGKSKGERHDLAMSFLQDLSDDVLTQISILLCVAPGESSLLDVEFRDPTRSQL